MSSATLAQQQKSLTSVDQICPEARGLHMLVKVISISATAERVRPTTGQVLVVSEVVVGDKTGISCFTARGQDQVSALKVGCVMELRNAKVEMFRNSFMRIVVDKWGSIIYPPTVKFDEDQFTVDDSNDVSKRNTSL